MKTDVEIPLREFRGPLKRHRLAENEPMSILIVDLAFPHFRGRDARDTRSNRIYEMFYGPQGAASLPAASPRRRFSGDSFLEEPLPRGRYFSVARPYPPGYSMDETQKVNDNGVVRNELMAYGNYSATGPLAVLDVHDRTDREVLRRLGLLVEVETPKPAFRTIFYRRTGSKTIFDVLLTEASKDSDWDWDEWGGMVTQTVVEGSPFHDLLEPGRDSIDSAQWFDLYYGFDEVSLDRVVDLRYPDTQEAVVRLFCPQALNANPEVGAVGGFLKLLPTLVSDDLGGTVETDAIGAYLRFMGAQALIYPSARCNVEVDVRDGDVVGYHGWNLVDYRRAAIDSMPDVPDVSLLEAGSGLRIEAPPATDHTHFGSWRIRGSAERLARRRDAEVKAYLRVGSG